MKKSREETNKRRRKENGKRLTPAMKRLLANAEHRPWDGKGKTLQNTARMVVGFTPTVCALERRGLVDRPFMLPGGETAALLRWEGFQERAKILFSASRGGETFTPRRSPSSISECSGRSEGRVIQ